MVKSHLILIHLVFTLLFVSSLFHVECRKAAETVDGSEEWGYVEVRPKAHMFWWLYRSPQRVDGSQAPWPTVLWLQGGPGGSGVAIGNFQEIGPLDTDLKPRSSTWLQKADLLFVDNPVGTGYSFVEEASLMVRTDWEAATDLTTLLKKLYNKNKQLQKSPLFIVAESYGGKFAVTAGLSIVKAIDAGELKLKLGGVALGDSWISPEDFVFSWGPLLLDVSRLDANAAEQSNSLAEKIRQEIQNGEYEKATDSWSDLEEFIISRSNGVDFYNFLLDDNNDPLSVTSVVQELEIYHSKRLLESSSMKRYQMYLSSSGNVEDLMNGVIREKLKIIPGNVSWGGQSDLVFYTLTKDFMKPRIQEVDELLSLGVDVTIYSGQLDVICATKGTEEWVGKLKWEGLKNFSNTVRRPLHCDSAGRGSTKGFFRSYQNLHFYWILGAGHFVPVDQPCISLKMIADITKSPAATL